MTCNELANISKDFLSKTLKKNPKPPYDEHAHQIALAYAKETLKAIIEKDGINNGIKDDYETILMYISAYQACLNIYYLDSKDKLEEISDYIYNKL